MSAPKAKTPCTSASGTHRYNEALICRRCGVPKEVQEERPTTKEMHTHYLLFLDSVREMIKADTRLKMSKIQPTYQPVVHEHFKAKFDQAQRLVISRIVILKTSGYPYTDQKSYQDIKEILSDHGVYGF